MPLFRAVPVSHASTRGEPQHPRESVRIPSNVPYVVDNLWESLRHDHLPCRRHAVYASPTPELALRCASPSGRNVALAVYEVVIDGPFLLAQLQVEDARLHRDIPAAQRELQKIMSALLAAPSQEKQVASLLFMPACSKDDWQHAVEHSPVAADFVQAAGALSTFWGEVSTEPTDSTGELFFQLGANASYRLAGPVPGRWS